MSRSLSVVQTEDALEGVTEVEPQGRFARLVGKVKAVRGKIGDMPSFPLFAQLRGLGSAAWLVGFVGSILILNRFVSPIITELAMTTLIAPIAALMLVLLGEFDFTKLTTMVTSNVGIVLGTGGIVIAALFVQNVMKMALLTKSLTSESHKQYRTYALASMFTPVTTSALWYLATKLGYFFGAKSISLGIMAIFASGAVGEALKSVDPMNATTADLATVASVMSNGLRWGLGFIVAIHLFFVFKSYGLVHKTLNVVFDSIAKKINDGEYRAKAMSVAKNNAGKLLILFVIVPVIVGGVASCVPTEEERKISLAEAAAAEKLAAEQGWRVACIGGVTYATEDGKAHRLTNKDGSSHCVAPRVLEMARMGEPFSVGKSYRHEVIELDAGGYDEICQKYGSHSDASTEHSHTNDNHSGRVDLNGNCRIDNTAKRDVRYWLELPEGLPKGVKMPPAVLSGK